VGNSAIVECYFLDGFFGSFEVNLVLWLLLFVSSLLQVDVLYTKGQAWLKSPGQLKLINREAARTAMPLQMSRQFCDLSPKSRRSRKVLLAVVIVQETARYNPALQVPNCLYFRSGGPHWHLSAALEIEKRLSKASRKSKIRLNKSTKHQWQGSWRRHLVRLDSRVVVLGTLY
jgi:hypothetical protein